MTAVVAAFTMLAVAVVVVVIWAVVLLIKDDFDDTRPVVVAAAQRRSSSPRTEPSRSSAQQRRTGTRPKDGETTAASARAAADAVHAERPGTATSVTQRLRALPPMTRLIAAGGASITVIALAVFAVSDSTGGDESEQTSGPHRDVASGPAEWRASVCRPDAVSELNALAEGIQAADLHVCNSANSEAGAVYIVSGNYDSEERLQYYLEQYSAFRDNPYAATEGRDGTVWAFVAFVGGSGQGDPALALRPLERFGFQVVSR
ncbi:hypothetical protein GR927_28390 [Mycolicibacterium sp. 3033]|nr:hypothetical protein [Mycolicibacterium aurantiacum]